jgi:hypothetical protein
MGANAITDQADWEAMEREDDGVRLAACKTVLEQCSRLSELVELEVRVAALEAVAKESGR